MRITHLHVTLKGQTLDVSGFMDLSDALAVFAAFGQAVNADDQAKVNAAAARLKQHNDALAAFVSTIPQVDKQEK